jgi:hypothetical protein
VRVAALIDEAKPADLPIEQPIRYLFEALLPIRPISLGLNLKTAKQMNLSVPNTVAALADEVVE